MFFLTKLLERFGFGPSFIQWISTLYNGANMRIIVNGWLTDAVPLDRGVRQGDSLSPLLYILCVKALACSVKKCPEIEGFLLPGAKGTRYKVGQYADDTTSFVKSIRSLERLFDVIHLYELGSGAKLNVSKTEAMWLGAWKLRDDQPLGLTWVKKMTVCLLSSSVGWLGLCGLLDTLNNEETSREATDFHLRKLASLALVETSSFCCAAMLHFDRNVGISVVSFDRRRVLNHSLDAWQVSPPINER